MTEDEIADADLIGRVASGERAAFEQVYLRYHRILARFLTRFTRRYELAEEIINDTLYVVWNKAHEFRGESKVSTWIIGIAYRRALKSLGRLDPPADPVEESQLVTASFGDSDEDRAEWVARGLAQLSLEHRMVIEMAYFLGYSCDEIAAIMESPVNTVKTRMFHARRRLRELLPRLAEPISADTRYLS